MSLGYYRKGRATRVKNIRISEISSVDRGAGFGVQVTLLKAARAADSALVAGQLSREVYDRVAKVLVAHANGMRPAAPLLPLDHRPFVDTIEKEESMDTVSIAKRAIADAEGGRVDAFAFDAIFKQCALDLNPHARDVNHAVSLFLKTHLGKSMNATARNLPSLAQAQVMKAAGYKLDYDPDAIIAKLGSNPPPRSSPIGGGDSKDDDDDFALDADTFNEVCSLYAAKNGVSKETARHVIGTKLLANEKKRRGRMQAFADDAAGR